MCIYLNLMILIKIIRGFISAHTQQWEKHKQRNRSHSAALPPVLQVQELF
ncbi:flagellar biosynthesis, FliO family protein [Escherichia coli]|nr:flagellar biosynthesis, FliO family protein [Escherichia coli]